MAAVAKSADSVSVRKEIKSEDKKSIPAGAVIISQEMRTTSEKIENGYLIIKNIETKYKVKGAEYSDWHSECKKWYSKEDPFTIDVKDKALAEAFEE